MYWNILQFCNAYSSTVVGVVAVPIFIAFASVVVSLPAKFLAVKLTVPTQDVYLLTS